MLMSSAESFNLLLDRRYVNQPGRENNFDAKSQIYYILKQDQKYLRDENVGTTKTPDDREYE